MSEPFIAEIRIMPYTFAPRDWSWCQGQLIPISSNTILYTLLGTTYGGDGRQTFGLPNLMGRAPMHPGRGPGLTYRTLGEHGGADEVTLNVQQIPAHKHLLQGAKGTGSDLPPDHSIPTANRMITGFGDAETKTPTSAYVKAPDSERFTQMASNAIGSYGNSQAHENRQPFLAVNFCIALNGIFPTRS